MMRGASLLSTVLLSACATTAPVPLGVDVGDVSASTADAVQSTSHHGSGSESCEPILRDLSVDWDQRDYWCDGGRLMVRRTVLLASLEEARRQLAALRRSADSIDTNTRRVLSRIDSRQMHDASESSVKTESPAIAPMPSRADSDFVESGTVVADSARIVFARGREVLGPRGRRAVDSLAQRVASGSRVTLRGHLIESEFPLTDPLAAERRSVGRSLAVREAWRDAGVDVAAVTILHHSGRFDGAYVEVVIDD